MIRKLLPFQFLLGMAKILDLGNTLQVFSVPRLNIPEVSFFTDDAKALEADWRAVGDDMRLAIAEFKEQHGKIS